MESDICSWNGMVMRAAENIAIILIILILEFILGSGMVYVGYMLCHAEEPSCPTDDSCTADYRDGEWHIEEVTP